RPRACEKIKRGHAMHRHAVAIDPYAGYTLFLAHRHVSVWTAQDHDDIRLAREKCRIGVLYRAKDDNVRAVIGRCDLDAVLRTTGDQLFRRSCARECCEKQQSTQKNAFHDAVRVVTL